YYGNTISYRKLCDEVNMLAGYLQAELGVAKGDRVVLYMQNSPQFIIAFYAILRANAVVVPINPMNTTDELEFYIPDCGAKVVIIGQELYERISPILLKGVLKYVIVAAYSDYLPGTTEYELP